MDFEEVVPAIWHAFHSLDGHQTGNGLKSQLKVLAFNIAMSLGVEINKEALEKYKEEETVCFEDFEQFVKDEIIDKVNKGGDQNANTVCANINNRIADTCWLVCQKRYVERREEKKLLSRDDIYKCWCVFNFLSEIDDNDKHITPIVTHRDEAALIMSKMQTAVGKIYDRDVFEEAYQDINEFSFEQFLHLIEHTCCKGLDSEAASVTIQDIYSEYILQVLKKGKLDKKSPTGHFRSWTERWFILTPKALQYYADKDEKELKGSVDINQHCRAGPNTSSSEKSRPHRFQVATKERTYELSAPDARTRTEWLTLINAAVESSTKPYGPQKMAWLKRRSERKVVQDRKRREEEKSELNRKHMEQAQKDLEAAEREKEELRRIMDEELKKKDSIIARLQEIERERSQLQQKLTEEESTRDSHLRQLQALEQERLTLREKLEQESVLYAAEKARSEELKRIHEELEKKLEEERQAKQDEEIARRHAAVALREELEKREELERLKEEQEQQLQEELKKRKDLEEFKKAQQELLEQERQKLEQLSVDRAKKDQELQDALEKISKAELAKQEIEKKVKDTQSPAFRKLLTDRIMQEIEQGTPEIISHRGKGAFTLGEFEQIGQMRKGQLSRDTSRNDSCVEENESETAGSSVLQNESEATNDESTGGVNGAIDNKT